MKKMKWVISALLTLFVIGMVYADKTVNDLVAEASKKAQQLSAKEANDMMQKGAVLFLDVRDQEELVSGKIPKSIHISRGTLEFVVASKITDKNNPIVVYCKKGGRGALATAVLKDMGYKNVFNIAGGFDAWLVGNFPVEK